MFKPYHVLFKFVNNIKSNIDYVNLITREKKTLQGPQCNNSGSAAGEMLALGSPGTAGPHFKQV